MAPEENEEIAPVVEPTPEPVVVEEEVAPIINPVVIDNVVVSDPTKVGVNTADMQN